MSIKVERYESGRQARSLKAKYEEIGSDGEGIRTITCE